MAPDLFSFSNRVALITGGGSGIGAYVAKGLAETGASRVYIIGRRVAGVEATTQAAPNVIIPIVGDVGTSEGCRKIVEAFEGGEKKAGIDAADIRLDLLFNNAGIAHEEGAWGPGATPEQVRDALLKASDTDWAHEFAVNVSCSDIRSDITASGCRLSFSRTSSERPNRITARATDAGASLLIPLCPRSITLRRCMSMQRAKQQHTV